MHADMNVRCLNSTVQRGKVLRMPLFALADTLRLALHDDEWRQLHNALCQ